jgi:AcrR family transcriptional regulator
VSAATGTRDRLSADDRRASIGDCARSLFATHGFHATTTRELAQAAGISDALLYRHFADKQAVLDYVVDQALDAFAGMPPFERLGQVPLGALLATLGSTFLRTATDNLDALVILISEHSSIDDIRFVSFVDESATRLGGELTRRFPSLDADAGYLTARSFFGSLVSFILLQRILGLDQVRKVDGDAYLAQLVTATVAGLA